MSAFDPFRTLEAAHRVLFHAYSISSSARVRGSSNAFAVTSLTAPIPRGLHLRQRVLAVVANALELSALDDRLGAIAHFEIAAALDAFVLTGAAQPRHGVISVRVDFPLEDGAVARRVLPFARALAGGLAIHDPNVAHAMLGRLLPVLHGSACVDGPVFDGLNPEFGTGLHHHILGDATADELERGLPCPCRGSGRRPGDGGHESRDNAFRHDTSLFGLLSWPAVIAIGGS